MVLPSVEILESCEARKMLLRRKRRMEESRSNPKTGMAKLTTSFAEWNSKGLVGN
jgi:hypothetical protein